MNCDGHQKVTASHLQRDAYLYVRQSTLRQVLENTESTQRQYALRQQAVALGWPTERVVVIDSDLGQSGASVADREGFQKLVTEVSLGRAGIVLGLEVSRLARNNADWHRLLEICALSDTLILDEDGLYDPSHFNDRLLLGLKGTMSEAELHVLRARLEGGIQSKARRGELKMRLPTGLVYDEQDRVVLDPDRQVQQSFFTFFETFQRTGTACATVRYFRQQGLLLPRRLRRGPKKGEVVWMAPVHSRALRILHNPRYAGVFYRGRTHTRKDAQGRVHIAPGFLRSSGTFCCRILTLDISAGNSFNATSNVCVRTRKPMARTAATVHRARVPRCCRALRFAGYAEQRMTVRYHSSKDGSDADLRVSARGHRTRRADLPEHPWREDR